MARDRVSYNVPILDFVGHLSFAIPSPTSNVFWAPVLPNLWATWHGGIRTFRPCICHCSRCFCSAFFWKSKKWIFNRILSNHVWSEGKTKEVKSVHLVCKRMFQFLTFWRKLRRLSLTAWLQDPSQKTTTNHKNFDYNSNFQNGYNFQQTLTSSITRKICFWAQNESQQIDEKMLTWLWNKILNRLTTIINEKFQKIDFLSFETWCFHVRGEIVVWISYIQTGA